ncbi:MAG: hypothetical protein E7417_01975 [Ruminococcaceae bacterium]|nr:hypothetical protein [Oscillospiraceae bacterium]
MILNALLEFFESCPYIADRKVSVNYLGHTANCASLEAMGEYSVIKKYYDGKGVYSQDFAFSIRCGFDGNVALNLRDSELMERLCLWIEQQNAIGNMPCLADGYSALKLKIIKMPYLYESSVQGARMQIEFSLIYKEV